MEFVVDGMLGKIARWLRMLGYDTKYCNNMSDDEILKVAFKEKRIILTRDYQFFRKANFHGVRAIFIEGKTHIEKLADLSRQLNIDLEINIDKSRCPKCNARIMPISKEEVKAKIPASTYKIYDEFWICTDCGQVYWKGSHWKKINNALNQARQIISEKTKLSPQYSG
ncbi:Mut7-C RNAse domain-containing protein [Candidatus Bathyarchaeota archaeon]|nr:Mut7-C RNAse domain-containing protein [Candidatus Bathyarchaeota archaeon]